MQRILALILCITSNTSKPMLFKATHKISIPAIQSLMPIIAHQANAVRSLSQTPQLLQRKAREAIPEQIKQYSNWYKKYTKQEITPVQAKENIESIFKEQDESMEEYLELYKLAGKLGTPIYFDSKFSCNPLDGVQDMIPVLKMRSEHQNNFFAQRRLSETMHKIDPNAQADAQEIHALMHKVSLGHKNRAMDFLCALLNHCAFK